MCSQFEEDNYIHHVQNQKFQESDFDPFQAASMRRKCLAQTFHAAITLGSNDTVCTLLKENLSLYAEIVDKNGPDTVNNYAKSMETLVSNCKSEHQQWKSGLHANDPASYIKHMTSTQCTLSDKSDKSCQSSEITMGDIQALLDNLYVPEQGDMEPTMSVPHSNLKPKLITPPTPNFNNNAQRNPVASRPVIATGSNCLTRFPEIPRLQHVRPNHFFRDPPAPPVRQHSNPSAQDGRVIRPAASTSRFPNTSVERETRENTSTRHTFISAREELGVQNQRKYGNTGAPAYGGHNYGEQKKSLGTRRGAFNKFIPPVRPDGDKDVGGRKRTRDEDECADECVDERLKNIDPKMVELIRSEIMDSGAAVAWDDIAGLEYAKATIQEIVVWPLLRPDIFTGLRRPPKGLLLFGPPGTGKTLIGKCIASQSRSTFFSISASSLTSKWIGDGEKMVRALFAVARCHQPAVVFIDEIDSMLTQRSDTEHESSRRIKTEFLVQLDGATTGEEDRILVVGATNRPQELDEAARRRLVKRLYIPLPETSARRQIVARLMLNERHSLTETDVDEISRLTAGYSGSDMKNLCQEASLGPIRSLGFSVHIEHIQPEQVRGIDISDFKAALSRVRASVSPGDLDSYVKWDNTYGSGGAPSN